MLEPLLKADDLFLVGSTERSSSEPGLWNVSRLLNDRNPDLVDTNEFIRDSTISTREDRR